MGYADAAPDLAARTVRELAALTDAELAADVLAAAAAVLERAETWRCADGWPWADVDRENYATVTAAAAALGKLADAAPAPAVVAAVTPILGAWWPDDRAAARPLTEAVERLRYAAMWQPRLADDARKLVAADLA